MYNLLEFLRSISVVVLFILLEIIAIVYYALSTPYSEAKVLGSVSGAIAAVNALSHGVSGYIHLGEENYTLMGRVMELEQENAALRQEVKDSLHLAQAVAASKGNKQTYIPAHVLYNTTSKMHNQIILNRGVLDGVRLRMALISLEGAMVGYISHCSDNYSVATSVLNSDFRSSGQIAGSPQVGSLYWDGTSRYHIQMRELSKYALPEVGAEVVSTSFSQIFPEGVSVGRIISFELDASKVSYNVNIELTADISAIHNLFIVGNNDYGNVERLLNGQDEITNELPQNSIDIELQSEIIE